MEGFYSNVDTCDKMKGSKSLRKTASIYFTDPNQIHIIQYFILYFYIKN